ncbi:MAG: TlpA family protein disulfide reductase [Deltaproteobacteria bacterium]|nr:TlpA family protein disulfide reductase [Deltaproteobacteria bacterium]
MKLALLGELFFIGLSAIGVYSFVRAAGQDERRARCSALCALRPTYAGRNRLAPDFELPDMEGRRQRLSAHRGRTVVLSFWTKTCKPCLAEMPLLGELATSARERGVVVLSVTIDEGPDDVREELRQAFSGRPAPFAVLFDPEMEVVRGKYGTSLFPETWIIDPEGVIRARFDGERDWSTPLVLDVLEMVGRPLGCPVELRGGVPLGPFASLCEEAG